MVNADGYKDKYQRAQPNCAVIFFNAFFIRQAMLRIDSQREALPT